MAEPSTGPSLFHVDTTLPATGIEGIDSPGLGIPDTGLAPPSTMPTFDGPMLGPGPIGTGSGTRQAVVEAAQKLLGTPYVWGGANPKDGGVDCSGLVQYVLSQYGFHVPRISKDQAQMGQRVALDQLQPGDLVAWDNSSRNNGADHIAIYIGGGKVIQAPRPGKNVEISDLFDTGQAWGVHLTYAGDK